MAAPTTPVPTGEVTLAEVIGVCTGRFDTALAAYEGVRAAGAVLDLEAEIVKWSADTEADDGGVDQARQTLRLLIARLGT
ncbi:hypothetical protein [Acrocarpospora catenulata]|uniref:hypothetical protein n=1 Tax=Acrocarpospora catenulata TaxID=2836182 RepID=UPI001BDA4C6E|nr:hypothetical protein [Acrocarpospora catenulata]